MDFFSDILPLIGAMIAIIAILYLTYLASKFVSKKYSQTSSGGSIQIVERMGLAQDKMLVIARVDGEYLLLGVANNSISILKELKDYEPPKNESQENFSINSFVDAFKKVSTKK
ncbi:MAG: flagellar biosynthetic protein FliO [Oscillospiraceae bacterium]|nr:flagellar biosynthetic protein FliO [Oscillospiraceae bacterium]